MLSIRTQDRMALVPYNSIIDIFDDKDIYCGENLLGTYKSKERALEVLDEIEKAVYENQMIYDEYAYNEFGHYKTFSGVGLAVYQMPKE